MKNIILMVVVAVLSISATYAQKDVPQAAIASLKQKFPKAEKVSWDKEKNGDFEAEFKLNGKEMSVTYSAKGEWLETETGILVSDLPAPVMAAFKKEHGAAKIKEVAKIESTKPIVYEIEYKDGLKTKEVMYDAQGKSSK